ncbi:MAG: HAMP domain-containing sensor histidine kinase [Candidatus Thorarchaeota archaeon]
MSTTRKTLFPAIFLIAAVVLSIIYNLSFEVRESGLDTIAFYSALALVTYTLLVLFQRFINYRALHFLLSIGWGLIFIASVEKLNAEILDTPTIDNEQFFTAVIGVGLILVAFGLYFWTRQMSDNLRTQEQQHRVIDLYTSLMSHDAGNDLQAVLGYIETALLATEGCNPKTLELMEAAQAAALRMTGLIKAFKPDEIGIELSLVPLVQSAAIQAEKADYGLKTNFYAQPGTENLKVAGASLIQFALANLMRNASQYAGEAPTADIKIFRRSDDLIITISDGGPGIPDDVKKIIFERGRSDAEHGLGLYLTRQIIAACSGTIELEDSPVGATFTIVLPIAE